MVLKIDFREILRIFNERLRIDQSIIDLANKYGYLPYMISRYIDMLGFDETIRLLEAFDNKNMYKPVIRCNDLRCSCRKITESLERLGFKLSPIEWSPYSYKILRSSSTPSIGATHEYLKGCYYLYRDAASLIPSIALDPRPGDLILDTCASPGGKASHILMLMRDEGLLIANDISRSRLSALKANLERMRFTSYIITRYDGRRIHEIFNEEIPKIILDAPCSAEGGIMFDPGRKRRTSYEDLMKLVSREIELLSSSVEALAPGGYLLYSTCSIAPEENEFVVSKILEHYKEKIEIIHIRNNIWDRGLRKFLGIEFDPDVEKCIRIWPHRHSMEGFFICLLRKR